MKMGEFMGTSLPCGVVRFIPALFVKEKVQIFQEQNMLVFIVYLMIKTGFGFVKNIFLNTEKLI